MAGFDNDVMYALNADFSQADNQNVSESNGLVTNGKFWIGSTVLNAGNTHINAGTITSPTATLIIGYSTPNITIEANGSKIGQTITGDTGGALSPAAGNWNIISNVVANAQGATVLFSGSGSTLNFKLMDANSNIALGIGAGTNFATAGNTNIAIGRSAMTAYTTGTTQNICIGDQAMIAGTQASGNIVIGISSASRLSGAVANSNIIIGKAAAIFITNAKLNILLGFSAGNNYTSTESSNILINNLGVLGESNVIRIGEQGSIDGRQNACYIAGIASVSVSNLNIVTIDTTTGQLGSQAASNVGTVTQFDVLVGGAAGAIASVGPGSVGQILQSAGNAANPVYSTATYPATTTSQQILYSTAANVIGQLTTANSALAATNSSGTLAMRAFSVVSQVFTSSGTYTPTTGMLYCEIITIGGGGAGGGATATAGGQFSAGGGGGAGEYASGIFSASTIGTNQSITIGAAGTSNLGATGGNGGNTSVGALISANGGIGGVTVSAAAAIISVPSLGGSGGSGGSIRAPGAPGNIGFGSVASGLLMGGIGANSQFGAGGIVQITLSGSAGLGNGSGGGGGSQVTSGTANSGGAGTKGIVIINEYVIA